MFSTRKRCLIGIPIRGYQNFYSLPPKNWILGPKTAKFGPKLAFWAKYWHFWPIWSNAWPKNNADKLSWWISVVLVPKLLLTPLKIKIFGPKSAFLVILGQILVGWLAVLARGLYLARHLFTLWDTLVTIWSEACPLPSNDKEVLTIWYYECLAQLHDCKIVHLHVYCTITHWNPIRLVFARVQRCTLHDQTQVFHLESRISTVATVIV